MRCEANTKSGTQCKNAAQQGSRFCGIHFNSFDQGILKAEYDHVHPILRRFADTLREQIETLIARNGLSLGVPIEWRVKSWVSFSEKLERKHVVPKSVLELDDLIGIRVILLFQRDLDVMHEFLPKELKVIAHENTATRLEETQFGYQSMHYMVAFPDEWLTVPTIAEFKGIKAELQLRTLAQHIWAAASHKLQYKNEQSVPTQLRRSIHRVSAILETVDLEFERLLGARDAYLDHAAYRTGNVPLNVDIVRQILSEEWPEENADQDEQYSSLLQELQAFGISTSNELRQLIASQRSSVMKAERTELKIRVDQLIRGEKIYGINEERVEKGVYFTHVGLTRNALQFNDPSLYTKLFLF